MHGIADEHLGKRLRKTVRMGLVVGTHALDERLAGFFALGAVVVAAVSGEYAFLTTRARSVSEYVSRVCRDRDTRTAFL